MKGVDIYQAGLVAALQTAWNSKQFSPPTRKGTIEFQSKLEFQLVNSRRIRLPRLMKNRLSDITKKKQHPWGEQWDALGNLIAALSI